MKAKTVALLRELINSLIEADMMSDAEEIKGFMKQLDSESSNERSAAARHISNRCHVKWYGDSNLPLDRPGDYPVLAFLSELRDAVQSEVQ